MADAVVDNTSVEPARKPGWVREFWPTILATLLILSSARPGAGFLLPLWLPILLVWFPRMAWLAWRRPARRKAQGIKAVAIVAALAVSAFAHGRYESEARAQAQRVVDAVTAYHVQHGSYPDDLAQVGLDADALRRDWQVRYWTHDGQHRVSYAAEFTVYDGYSYDFDKPGWVYSAE
ncbi:hypothetical protein [Scleromatobacter humisilvae]|uniref:Uncharacterized protein n=1 Tax=Scleromatobacter humisilvae TaxID=2897159 RepID=A0A9X2C2D2_9BURK|nr:hypothetical protein [Scleromatobacter humisilvae]MCK9686704.1 hypothetical protein [Scleromatobacter humisilvae]